MSPPKKLPVISVDKSCETAAGANDMQSTQYDFENFYPEFTYTISLPQIKILSKRIASLKATPNTIPNDQRLHLIHVLNRVC